MAESTKIVQGECTYRELLKDYCGQVAYWGNDDRIQPVSLEGIYTPLRMREGKPDERETIFQSRDNKEELDYTEVLNRLDKQIDELLASFDQKEKGENYKGKRTTSLNVNTKRSSMIAVVYGRPGGGKTTWSKRVCLACLSNDEPFFLQQPPLEKWYKDGTLPVLLCCRNMIGINDEKDLDLISLAYALVGLSFGRHFHQTFSEQSFRELLNEKASNGKLLLIVDGWDELADEESEKHLESCLESFLSDRTDVKCAITTRNLQKQSNLFKTSFAYTIESLDSNDVELFCRRWHEEIFRGDPQRVENYKTVLSQLESPFFGRISYMTKTPYLLSNLLRCSQYYGRLPSSIVELYDRIIDMLVEWFTKLDTGLEKHDVKIQLSYIACAMTKSRSFTISKTDLCELIKQCFIDLDGLFRRPLLEKPVQDYLKLFLARNCVLDTTYGGLYHFPHREMQEYLSAVAIVNGYSDAGDNRLDPFDILKRYYASADQSERRNWETIVVFSTLIGGTRFARAVVNDIINLAEKDVDDSYSYRNLLFSFILDSVDLLKNDRLRIYEVCFASHISAQQIKGICQLAEQSEVGYSELSSFIESKFVEGVKKGDLFYCFAWAIIYSKRITSQGHNPLYMACNLLIQDDIVAFSTGLVILDVFAWCKYDGIIGNEFSVFYREDGFQIPSESCNALQIALAENVNNSTGLFVNDIARTINTCTLAGFIAPSKVREIVPEDIISSFLDRVELFADNRKALDRLLAVYTVPTLENISSTTELGSEQVRTYYENQFYSDLMNSRRDACAFSFNRCLALGIWKTEELVKENLKKLNEIQLDTPNKTRLSQIQKMLAYFSFIFGTDPEGKVKEYEFYIQNDEITADCDQYIYLLSEIYKLSADDLKFPRISLQNNIAYLMRRGELRGARVEGSKNYPIGARELLEEGVEENEGFSLTNYALSLSGFSKDNGGSYDSGLAFLQVHFSIYDKSLPDIKKWWWRLAKEKGELEGAVVLMWLYELKLINIDGDTANEMVFSYNDVEFLISHFKEKVEKLGEHSKATLLSIAKAMDLQKSGTLQSDLC